MPRNLGKLSARPCRSTCRQPAHATATDAKRQGREGACPSNAISCHFYFPPWLHECVHARHRGSSVKRPTIIPDIDLRYIHELFREMFRISQPFSLPLLSSLSPFKWKNGEDGTSIQLGESKRRFSRKYNLLDSGIFGELGMNGEEEEEEEEGRKKIRVFIKTCKPAVIEEKKVDLVTRGGDDIEILYAFHS